MNDLYKKLEAKIQSAYEEGTTLEAAERLASEFLYAQIQVSQELQKLDLSARMRKSGVKAVRGAIYLDIVQKAEKKPTEAQIGAMVDTDEIVNGEQKALDEAESERDAMERFFSIFQNAHIHFRSVSRGKFE